MSRHAMPEIKEGGVNVTPLIDVVMCLIIFFMLVAKIGVTTGGKALELPQTVMGKKMTELGDTIILSVTDPNLERGADGKPVYEDAEHEKRPKRKSQGPYTTLPKVEASLGGTSAPADIAVAKYAPGNSHPIGYPLREELTKAYNVRKAQKKERDFSVTIRAERDLPFSMLQQVLAEVASAGIQNVNFGSKQKDAKVTIESK